MATPSSDASDAPVPAPAVFRTPLVALVAVVFVLMAVSTIAFQGGWWWLTMLIPVALAWWVVRTRTVVDHRGIHVRAPWGARWVPWSDVATLRLVDRGWVRAVRPGGDEVVLRGVRVSGLGRVGEASGGRLTVPTPAEARAAMEHQRELEAARLRVARLRETRAHDGILDDGPADTEVADGSDTPAPPTVPDSSEGTAENRA